jgi:hypothetical protein
MKGGFSFSHVCASSAAVLVTGGLVAPMLGKGSTGATMNGSGELAKAILLYATDNDDRFPLAIIPRENGTWNWASAIPTPADAIGQGPWSQPASVARAGLHWANTVRPYVNDETHYRDASQIVQPLPMDVLREGVTPLSVGLTLNGLLHLYPKSSVTNPGLVPLVWAGTGSYAIKGRGTANPVLMCIFQGPCAFTPSPSGNNPPPGPGPKAVLLSPSATFFNGTVWSLQTGENSGGGTIATIDGAAKFMEWGTVQDPGHTTSAANDIFAAVYREKESLRQGFYYWSTSGPDCTDVSDSAVAGDNTYPCFFRPDRVK